MGTHQQRKEMFIRLVVDRTMQASKSASLPFLPPPVQQVRALLRAHQDKDSEAACAGMGFKVVDNGSEETVLSSIVRELPCNLLASCGRRGHNVSTRLPTRCRLHVDTRAFRLKGNRRNFKPCWSLSCFFFVSLMRKGSFRCLRVSFREGRSSKTKPSSGAGWAVASP